MFCCALSGPQAVYKIAVKLWLVIVILVYKFFYLVVLSRARWLMASQAFGEYGRRGNEYGCVGEAWCALKGDRILAMHRPFQGLSYGLNKNAPTHFVNA